MNIEDYKLLIKDFSNEKLVEVIVSSRYLNLLKDEAISCMEELVIRRKNGDAFNFEEGIQQKINELPKFKTDLKRTVGFNIDLRELSESLKKI